MSERTSIFHYVVRRPVATAMFFGALSLLGAVSCFQLPLQLAPDVTLPQVGIHLMRPGYSQTEMEDRIVRPVEGILAGTARVREIVSRASAHAAHIQVKFDYGTDVRFCQLDLQEKINQLSKSMGQNRFWFDVTLASTLEFESYFIGAVLRGDPDESRLRQIAEERIAPVLQAIAGVAEVQLGGGRERAVEIAFEPDLLDAYGISADQAVSRLRQSITENFNVGQVQETQNSISVILRNRFESLEDIRQTAVDDQGVVGLGDVAEVKEALRYPPSLFRYNGEAVVGMTIRKEINANPVRLSRKILAAVAELEPELPRGCSVQYVYNLADYIQMVLRRLTAAALAGALLSVAVLLVFLRDPRTSLIVSLAIPISIVGTFNLMLLWGMSINVLTLLGLALGVGLLVDSAIVVLESIYQHYERKHDALEAGGEGARQVGRALFATTATNAIVFVPVLYSQGEIQRIFHEGALAIILPQVVSLAVALTLVPVLVARTLKPAARRSASASSSRWRRLLPRAVRLRNPYWPAYRRRPRRLLHEFYGVILRAALRHRLRVLALVILTCLLTWHVCVPRLRLGMLDVEDAGGSIGVFFELPNGSRPEEIDRAVQAAEKAIAKIPEVNQFETWGNRSLSRASIYVRLKPRSLRQRSAQQVRASLLEEIGPIPGVTMSLRSFNHTEPVNAKEGGELEISGEDNDTLHELAATFAVQIQAMPAIAGVELDTHALPSELHFRLDRFQAAMFHVSPPEVAHLVETTQSGGRRSQMWLDDGSRRTEIYLRSAEQAEVPALDSVQGLRLVNVLGDAIPLKELGRFVWTVGDRAIERQNLRRVLKVRYYFRPRAEPQKVNQAVGDLIQRVYTPPGVTARLGGQNRQIAENVNQVRWMMEVALLLIYMTLACVFESFLMPLVILITVPFGALGVIWTLLFSGTIVDELALFGGLMLAGIVVNNGIVLLDWMGALRREKGYRRTRAVVEACHNRLRPILMTALTTILGVLPMALEQSEDFQWASLAVVIGSGVASSTILTLIILPAMAMNAEDALAWLGRAARGIWGRAAAPGAPACEPRVVMRQVYLTYPVFQPAHLGRIVPSTRYKYGARPPEGIEALRGVDLTLERGMCALLGPNGAGKTTLLRSVAGLLRPTRGYVEVCGVNLAAKREEGRRHIGYLPQFFGIPADFSAREFLDLHALMAGLERASERRRRVEQVLESVNLLRVGDQRIGGFSGGMKQRLGIARVLLKLPQVLIVDEPTAGLDPIERVKFRNLLARLSAERVVLFSTHIIEDISASCRWVAVVLNGRLVFQGTPEELAARARGHVWTYVGEARENADLAAQAHILRRQTQDHTVLYRLVGPARPRPQAQAAEPTLEDAYMALALGQPSSSRERASIEAG